MPESPALVVGLGNPGPEYERTRHNVGFRVVEILCQRLGARLRGVKGVRGRAAGARDGERRVILAEPQTFMNLSGEAVRELARYYKVALDDIVVVHDDLDLPLGTLRVKRGGGDAGHNGLRHVTRALGSPDYARVRIGIGRPPGRKDPADYVLEPFGKRELPTAEVVLEEAADAALAVVREGVEAVQNRLHAPEPRPGKRKVRKQAVVDAPVQQVWESWTTAEGAQTFFAPRARIELREGGPYEILFAPEAPEGERGAEGCRVIAFSEPHSLSFTWNQPPSIPALRWEYIRVDVALRAAGRDRTRVTITHTGWGEGPDWDRAVEYFERAWDLVLARLQRRFAKGPVDWSAAG